MQLDESKADASRQALSPGGSNVANPYRADALDLASPLFRRCRPVLA